MRILEMLEEYPDILTPQKTMEIWELERIYFINC